MNTESRDKMCDLLRRAGVSEETIAAAVNRDSVTTAVEVASDMLGDRAPDDNWLRDWYLVTGDHMVRTEEGWIPAEMNTREHTGEDPMEVLEEVNAPTVAG